VTAGYAIEGEGELGLGVLGSTRMEYARMIALVDHVGRAVRSALRELGS
jgi:transcriptional regulator of heat shock response